MALRELKQAIAVSFNRNILRSAVVWENPLRMSRTGRKQTIACAETESAFRTCESGNEANAAQLNQILGNHKSTNLLLRSACVMCRTHSSHRLFARQYHSLAGFRGLRELNSISASKTCLKQAVRKCQSANQFLENAALSAIYIGHAKGLSCPVKLDLDLEGRFADLDAVRRNIQARKMDIDVDLFYSKYKAMLEMQERLEILKATKIETSSKMKRLLKNQTQEKAEEIEKKKEDLVIMGRTVRAQLKLVTEEYNAVEDSVTMAALRLPADLHPSTPAEDAILRTLGEKPLSESLPESHLQVAQLAVFFNKQKPGGYYLLGDLVTAQMHIENQAKSLLSKSGFLQLSCPDIVRKLVVEGCGRSIADPDEVFMVHRHGCDVEREVEDNPTTQMYLTGLSPEAFIAYVAMTEVTRRSMPLRVYGTGSQFTPKPAHAPLDLLNVPQACVVELFGASETREDMEQLYHDFIQTAEEFYKHFNLHFRVVNVGVERLERRESARTEIQVWMPATQSFAQVGKVAMWSDYASRRLMIYSAASKAPLFTVHSTMVRIPTLLAALIETTQSTSFKL